MNDKNKIAANLDRKAWAEFTNCFNELSARGYEFHEAGGALSHAIKDKGYFDDIFQAIGHDPKWKKFEKIVAGIHELKAEGAIVKYNDQLLGKHTGSKRQIDVSLRFDHGYYQYLVVIECKDLNSKVPIGEVEAFCTKIEDVGADKGVMVSALGFQKGAISAAKVYNVDLYTLTSEMKDWTEIIRNHVISLPMPTHIEIDHPPFSPQSDSVGDIVKFGAIYFYHNEKTPPVSLLKILINICTWVDDNKLKLPCIVNLKFLKELFVKFPNISTYIPINGIRVRLEKYQHQVTHKIDIAPRIQKYVYSDVNKEKVYVISSDKIGI